MATLGRALTGAPQEPSQLYALHLIRPTERASFHLRHDPEKASGDSLTPLLGRANGLGMQVRPISFVSAEPALDICRTAEAKQANLVLLGWHKPLFSRTMLGGTVHEVMQEANTSVAVLVDRGLEHVRRVLVGLARRLLQHASAEITILHVTQSEGQHGHSGARPLVEKLFPQGSGTVHFKVVAHDSPEEAALEESRRGYDLVVVGVGAEWGLEDGLFGLHRERLIGDAPTSLLVVRHPAPAPAAEATPETESAGELAASNVVS
jgi:nucleotide-binding universal stress UspA family protein